MKPMTAFERYCYLAIVAIGALVWLAGCTSQAEQACATRFVEGGERYNRCVDTASVQPSAPRTQGNRDTLVVAPNANRRVLFVE